MAEVRIKVGCAIDPSMRTAFRPLVQSAVDARRQILGLFAGVPKEIVAAMGGLGRAQGATFRGMTAEARRAFREQTEAAREARREQTELARRAERESREEARRTAREKQALERAADSLSRQRSRALEADFRRGERERAVFASRTSDRAMRFLVPNMPIASMARRAGSEVVRGFGVDPTVSGAFQRNVALETLAVNATNQARLSGQNIAPSSFEASVRDVSTKRGMSRADTAEGLGRFQALTGDLSLGMSLLDKMAERAAATDAKFGDMAATAANVSNALGNIPNKEQAILDIIDQTIAQGARGAVEMKDLASHMARVAAAATRFGGDPAKNIKMAGALVQLARAEGGAPSAAEATRSIVGFANTMQKGARLRAFEAATGRSAFTDEGKTELRGMDTLIKEALVATGGNREKMNKIFMDVVGARTVDPLIKAFNKAGGGDAGLSAVDKKIGRFLDAPANMQNDLDAANRAREETAAFKAQRFQNTLDDTAKEVQASLLPALEKLAPTVITVAEVLGSIVKIGLDNPGAAIVAAITASIARAGLESALRAALERSIMGAGGALGGKGGVGALGAGAIGLGLGTALATGIYTEGVSAVDASEKRMTGAGKDLNEVRAGAKDAKRLDPKQRDKLFRKILDEREAIKQMEARRANPLGNDFFDVSGQWDNIKSALGISNTDTEIKSRKGMLAEREAEFDKIRKTKFEGPDEVSKFVAKDPSKHSRADLQKAFEQGGIPALEKIATLSGKQDDTAKQMLEQQKSTNNKLDTLIEKLPAASGRDPTAPAPDEEF